MMAASVCRLIRSPWSVGHLNLVQNWFEELKARMPSR